MIRVGLLVASLLVLGFMSLSLLWHMEDSPYRTGRLALLTQTDQGDSLYIVDLAVDQVDFLFSPDGAGTQLFWSPDRNRLVRLGYFSIATWIVDVAEREFIKIGSSEHHWSGFTGWTPDGHYAVFSNSDQYGNSSAAVFDAWQWITVINTTATRKACPNSHSMSGGCYRRAAAISPFTPTLLLQDGSVLNLTDLTETSVFSKGLAHSAQWSNNGEYMVWVHHLNPGECYLCLANADGTQPLSLATVPCDYQSLQWELDGSAALFAETSRYILDPVKRQVEILPADADSMPSISQKDEIDPCGDCDGLLSGESSLGEITAACWSPDKALLAVGKPGNLSVYDADLNLLRTFVVSGTVETLAWSLAYDR